MAKFTLTNPGAAADVIERAVEVAMLEIMRDAREAAPVDTGNLANSIITQGPYKGMKGAYGFVGTNVTYAPFIEFGTGEIHPRSASVLSWTDKGGVRHFARSVGPRKARPFLGPALEKARRKFG